MHDESKWKGKYRIPSARKVGWDYSSASWYFITINAYAETPPFGEVRDGEMFRNALGESVARNWLLTLDEYADVVFDEWQVMPDHFHALLWLDGTPLGTIVRRMKGRVTSFGRNNQHDFVWQTRFHDHMVEYQDEFERISQYIRENPRNYKTGANPLSPSKLLPPDAS